MIVLTARIDGYKVRLALDTGATHTVVDLSEVIVAGYGLNDSIGLEEYETANGNVMASIFRIRRFEVLGEKRADFTISAYDYLASGVLADINGVLGLDFFQNRTFCINMEKKEISF